MNLDDALQTFIVESRELLQQMEEALLRIEQAPDDSDTINAIFRAAHTIQGNGEVALILDIPGLMRRMAEERVYGYEAGRLTEAAPTSIESNNQAKG